MLPKTYGLNVETLQPPDFRSGGMTLERRNMTIRINGFSSNVYFPAIF